MLTEGDRVMVNAGDYMGDLGTVTDVDVDNNTVVVELDITGRAGFRPERLVPVVDNVNHPKHYTSHPSGVEVIQITEHMGFCLGNAVKYILRSDLKGNAIEDLRKAAWYINREIEKREASA